MADRTPTEKARRCGLPACAVAQVRRRAVRAWQSRCWPDQLAVRARDRARRRALRSEILSGAAQDRRTPGGRAIPPHSRMCLRSEDHGSLLNRGEPPTGIRMAGCLKYSGYGTGRNDWKSWANRPISGGRSACFPKSSSPIAAKLPAGSSRPRGRWASRRSRSIPTPMPMRCMWRWPTRPCTSARRRPTSPT
jgi:hypothetical protein